MQITEQIRGYAARGSTLLLVPEKPGHASADLAARIGWSTASGRRCGWPLKTARTGVDGFLVPRAWIADAP